MYPSYSFTTTSWTIIPDSTFQNPLEPFYGDENLDPNSIYLQHLNYIDENLEEFEKCINKPFFDINAYVNDEEQTFLYLACRNGNLQMVRLLLDHRDIDLNQACGNPFDNPLSIVIQKGYLDILVLLLEEVRFKINEFNIRPAVEQFFLSYDRGQNDIVYLLLFSANLDLIQSCLRVAIQKNDFNLVKVILLNSRVKISDIDHSQREELLNLAYEKGRLEITTLLLESIQVGINQVSVDCRDNHLPTALYAACRNGNVEIVKSLLENPYIEVNSANHFDETPLYQACHDGHLEIVKLLLESPSIELNARNDDFNTPLQVACQQGHLDIIALLLGHPSIDINNCDKYENSSLYPYYDYEEEVFKEFDATYPEKAMKEYIESSRVRLLLEKEELEIRLKGLEGLHLEAIKRILADDKANFPPEDITSMINRMDDSPELYHNDKNHKKTALIKRFFAEPPIVRDMCRADIERIDQPKKAASLFAMTIFFCDRFMTLSTANDFPQDEFQKIERFFTLASGLPMELQMVLCNRAYDVARDIIPLAHRELAFWNLSNDRLHWLPR